ncbi:MAG: TIGR03936 family radical SAM-associated protein [Mobilitalea sp.]
MKVRIKFQKFGTMKFVGHLDVMRYFQKAFRRSEFDSEYTKGYHPHQIMSFAAPLGVGLTSDAEYVDIQLLTSDSPEIMIQRLNAVLTEGCNIIDFHPLIDREEHQKAVTAMSLVTTADYLVSLKDGYLISDAINSKKEFEEAFQKFMELPEILIDKKTKKSEKVVDIKQLVNFMDFDEKLFEGKCQAAKVESFDETDSKEKMESVADVYQNGIKVFMQIDTGSASNLKPELVLEAFHNHIGAPFNVFAWQVHRLEVYTKDEESGKLAALNQVDR